MIEGCNRRVLGSNHKPEPLLPEEKIKVVREEERRGG